MYQPVFLQTGFRSGGTWLWSCFRKSPQVVGFCEPLNEVLATITLDTIGTLTSGNSNLSHPSLEAPYFFEFKPFLNESGTGVRNYRPEFGLNSYLDPADSQPEGLSVYLQQLSNYALQQRKCPVFKFTRALARAPWLRQVFPVARQLLLLRNPRDQFRSGVALARRHSNFTFLMIPLFVISRSSQATLVTLCDVLQIPRFPLSEGIGECFGRYTEMAERLEPEVLFQAFLGMYIASYAHASRVADVTISYELMVNSDSYRKSIQAHVESLTGLDVTFSADPRIKSTEHCPARAHPSTTEQDVLSLLAEEFPAAVEEVGQFLD